MAIRKVPIRGARGIWTVAPAVSTPHSLRGTRQDLPCTSAGKPRTPVGSPVRAPHWSSAEVFSWQQRGGREGERPRRCRPSADSIRAGVRSKAHRFVVAGRAGCTGSRSVAGTAGHQDDEHVPRALLVPGRGDDHGQCAASGRRGLARASQGMPGDDGRCPANEHLCWPSSQARQRAGCARS